MCGEFFEGKEGKMYDRLVGIWGSQCPGVNGLIHSSLCGIGRWVEGVRLDRSKGLTRSAYPGPPHWWADASAAKIRTTLTQRFRPAPNVTNHLGCPMAVVKKPSAKE